MDEKDEITLENKCFSDIKEYPECLIYLVNKYVTVQLIKNISFNGFVQSIDPVSKSIILSIPKEQVFVTTILPGHAIEDVKVISPPENITAPTRKDASMQDKEEVLARKTQLIQWFESNFLPVTENGDNIVVGRVEVLPPYTIADIYAENPIVSLSIRNIMEKMPTGLKSSS